MRLDPIKPLFERAGPFVTLHVEVGRDTADAVSQRDARWTTARHDLEHAEVDDALIEEIGERLLQNTHLPGAVRRTLVAAEGQVLLDEVRAGRSPQPETVEVASLPQLAGWLSVEDAARRFVLVNADRVGADVSLHEALASAPREEHSVDGADFYITKVAEGDWAQKQFQQTAENTWQDNARLVRDDVVALCRRHPPSVVLLAGETRARAEVRRAFEEVGTLPPVVDLEAGGRAEGASVEALWTEIEQAMARVVAERDADLAARLEEGRGRGEGAATGLDQVVEALTQSRAEEVAIDLAAMAERTVSSEAFTGVPLPRSAVEEQMLPADRALVAAAALTGAALTPVPANLSGGEGVAALLRWS